ncbi:unnamed protein product [Rotaria magnacalcarata]|nr:unnamed protein product [Rotaria magnacalcarata]CAF1540919.1 unnamed protein product [Rotaria magnacalcarata]CAF2044829.1 unnamed protein product [Rotaria magnacalcarata]CAF2055502.1 unnamed protein product [Rotaria magnacalcarata]CAF2079327.1 unnamed protein product [Rotaria magnacalcarata]
MGNKVDRQNNLKAPSTTVTSFVYEDLISHVQTIQTQMAEVAQYLDDRWKNEKKIRNELKSRSIIVIDPYKNPIANEYMNHELLGTLFKQFKQDYVPKYLQKWIKIGKMNENVILPLDDSDLKSSVSEYPDGYQFITYGELNISIEHDEHVPHEQVVLPVLLTDTVEKIQMQLKNLQNIELKSFIVDQDSRTNKPNWSDGRTLKSDDTILSCQLYQDKCIIIAKVSDDETDTAESGCGFKIFIKTGTGKTMPLKIYYSMDVATLKALIQDKEGTLCSDQRLYFAGRLLEDGLNLSDYSIQKKAVIYMCKAARGGMYHFTSGRIDFERFPETDIKTIKDVLAFKFKHNHHHKRLSLAELQNSVLQGQGLLLKLFKETKDIYTCDDVPQLKNIILSTVPDNDDDEISNDQ